MILEFIRPFRHYSQGTRIDCPGGQADLFIRRGYAKPVEEKKPPEKKKIEAKK